MGETATGGHLRIASSGYRDRDHKLMQGRRCPQKQFHVRPIHCKSMLLAEGNGSQITRKERYLWSKEGASALTQRAVQSMQQARKRTYGAAT